MYKHKYIHIIYNILINYKANNIQKNQHTSLQSAVYWRKKFPTVKLTNNNKRVQGVKTFWILEDDDLNLIFVVLPYTS